MGYVRGYGVCDVGRVLCLVANQGREPASHITPERFCQVRLAAVVGIREFKAWGCRDQGGVRGEPVALATLVEPFVRRHEVPEVIYRVDSQWDQMVEIISV